MTTKLKALGRYVFARGFGVITSTKTKGGDAKKRVLYVSNAYIPTLQLSFVKPLSSLVEAGEVATELLSEQQMKEAFGKKLRDKGVHEWLDKRLSNFKPTVMVFCRYSGPHVEYLLEEANNRGIATVFHLDDDLLNVPEEIGQKKYEYHNHPLRLAAVKSLLCNADLVYFSTSKLKERFTSYGATNRSIAGKIYCSGEVLVTAVEKKVTKLGYMGFDHAHDFELVLPALIKVLEKYPDVVFELFGSIPKPPSLDMFGDRVRVLAPVPDYGNFMKKFSTLGWDIGLCPLAKTSFNSVKANTKWVEYTSIGAAVVATEGQVYDECCADSAGVLVAGSEQWLEALDKLISDPGYRYSVVAKAQDRLAQEFSVDSLREQVLNIFELSLERN